MKRQLTKGEKANLRLQILRKAKEDKNYEKYLIGLMKTKQEKIDWLKANLSTEEKAKRMFQMKKNRAERLEGEELIELAKSTRSYLTPEHQANSEKAMAQIAEWQKNPPTLEEALKRQKEREKE